MASQKLVVNGLFHHHGMGRMYRTKQAFLDDFGKIVKDSELDGEDLEDDEVIFVSFEMLKEALHELHYKSTPSMFEALASPFIGSSSSKSVVKKLLYRVMNSEDLRLQERGSKQSSSSHGVYGKKCGPMSTQSIDRNESDVDGLYFPPNPRKYSVDKLKLPAKRGLNEVAAEDMNAKEEDDNDRIDDKDIQSPDVMRKSKTKRPKQLTPKHSDHERDHNLSSPELTSDADIVKAIFDLIENWELWSQRTYPYPMLQNYLLDLGWTKKSVRLNAVSVDKTDIFLPTWSQDFDLTAIETTMEKNRDYFVDIDDVRSYINRKCSRKKGIVRARTPATPEDGIRPRVKQAELAKKEAAIRAEKERQEKKRREEENREERKRKEQRRKEDQEKRRLEEEEEQRREALFRAERTEIKRQQAERRAAREAAMKADEEKAVAKAKAIQEEYDFAMDVPGDDPKVTALHCVKYWDILSTKHYVFNLLWPALKKLDWTEEVSTSRNLMLGSVFVPSWAQDRFERAGKDPESLVQNRDFFVNKNDVRDYISKYGLTPTKEPPTPVDSRRRRTSRGSATQPLVSSPFVQSMGTNKKSETSNGDGSDEHRDNYGDDNEDCEVQNTVLDLVRNWDSYSLTKYPWTSLWMGLQALKWQQLPVCRGYERCSHVFVPPWAADKFYKNGCNPNNLDENRDYFHDPVSIRAYISKYELHSTSAPPTVHKRTRKPVQRMNPCDENGNNDTKGKRSLEEIESELSKKMHAAAADVSRCNHTTDTSRKQSIRESSSSTPNSGLPYSVTKEKLTTTPTDSVEAAVHIVRKWEIYQQTTYPWPLLWSHLYNCDWREVPLTESFPGDDSTVFVPPWAMDKCEGKKRRINIKSLKKNKDYFISCEDIRAYINKNGLKLKNTHEDFRQSSQQEKDNFGSPEEKEIIEAAVEATPIDDDKAAAYIVKHWDEYSKTTYAWPILWTRLERLGWKHRSTLSFMAAEYVYVPPWAVDAFNDAESNPSLLTENREYFIAKEDVQMYIGKYGVEKTVKPISPIGRRRHRALYQNGMENNNRNNMLKTVQETLIPITTKNANNSKNNQAVIPGRSLQRSNSVTADASASSSSVAPAGTQRVESSPLSEDSSGSPYQVAGKLPHASLRRAYDPEHNFERLIADSSDANFDISGYNVRSIDGSNVSTPSKSSSTSNEHEGDDIDGFIYNLLQENPIRFSMIMSALRQKGWHYVYPPRKAWEGFEPFPPGLEHVYFRKGITPSSSHVIRNEDYFYSEEDVLNNLRVNYGLIAVIPSNDAGKDDDDDIGVVGRLRRTTRPALSASAEKENKKPLKTKRKITDQSSAASSPASSVGTSVSSRQSKRVKTSSNSNKEVSNKLGQSRKQPLRTIEEGEENKIDFGSDDEGTSHDQSQDGKLTFEEAVELADRDLSANHDILKPLGRESETSTIYNQLLTAINSLEGGSIYVCGSPGVGKTFTVNGVLKKMMVLKSNKGSEKKGNILNNDFTIIRGQGTSMSSAYQHLVCDPVNSEIFEDAEDSMPEHRAKSVFYEHLSAFKGLTILVLDEVDQIHNNVLSELYNNCEEYPLFIIGLANSIDFMSFTFPKFNVENASIHTELLFVHYSVDTIKDILKKRSHGLLEDSCITLLAKKSASYDGDIRAIIEAAWGAITDASKKLTSDERKQIVTSAPVVGADGKLSKPRCLVDMKSVVLKLRQMGYGATQMSEYLQQLTVPARIALVGMVLQDPLASSTLDLYDVGNAVNTYRSELQMNAMSEEDILPLIEQMHAYGFCQKGDEGFGRKVDNLQRAYRLKVTLKEMLKFPHLDEIHKRNLSKVNVNALTIGR